MSSLLPPFSLSFISQRLSHTVDAVAKYTRTSMQGPVSKENPQICDSLLRSLEILLQNCSSIIVGNKRSLLYGMTTVSRLKSHKPRFECTFALKNVCQISKKNK